MVRNFIAATLLSLGLCSAASARDQKQIVFDGTQLQQQVQLNSVVTHTEYTNEQREKTCYRREQSGSHQECRTEYRQECNSEYKCHDRQVCNNERECHYEQRCTERQECRSQQVCHDRQECTPRQVCHDRQECHEERACRPLPGGGESCRSQQVCHSVPDCHTENECRTVPECHTETACRPVPDCRNEEVCNYVPRCHNEQQCGYEPVCRNVPYQDCHEEPDYRDVPYTCYETVPVPHEVKDFDVVANVKFEFTADTTTLKPQELLGVVLDGDKLQVQAMQTSKQFLLFADKQQSEQVSGQLKTIETLVRIHLVDSKVVAAPFNGGVLDMAFQNDKASFSLAPFDASLTKIVMKVNRRTMKGPVMVFARELLPQEITTSILGLRTKIETVTLAQLGLDKVKGGIRITIEVSPKLNGATVLNPQDLGVVKPATNTMVTKR